MWGVIIFLVKNDNTLTSLAENFYIDIVVGKHQFLITNKPVCHVTRYHCA
ncbi:hypothetical protein yrohd0001_19480 [Yersinia rohdei ATCC 43380]|nr:hypothetical protein yrohd0001_19480 [Yersinia rohdei ATCC 43380]